MNSLKIYIWFAWPVVTIHGCLDLNKIQTCNSENSSFKVFFVALVKLITVCELQGVIVNTAFMACLLSFTRNHCLFTLLPVELSRIWRSETAVGDNSTLNNPLSTIRADIQDQYILFTITVTDLGKLQRPSIYRYVHVHLW